MNIWLIVLAFYLGGWCGVFFWSEDDPTIDEPFFVLGFMALAWPIGAVHSIWRIVMEARRPTITR